MFLALWFAISYDQDSGLRLEMLFFLFQVNLTLFISGMFQILLQTISIQLIRLYVTLPCQVPTVCPWPQLFSELYLGTACHCAMTW